MLKTCKKEEQKLWSEKQNNKYIFKLNFILFVA